MFVFSSHLNRESELHFGLKCVEVQEHVVIIEYDAMHKNTRNCIEKSFAVAVVRRSK